MTDEIEKIVKLRKTILTNALKIKDNNNALNKKLENVSEAVDDYKDLQECPISSLNKIQKTGDHKIFKNIKFSQLDLPIFMQKDKKILLNSILRVTLPSNVVNNNVQINILIDGNILATKNYHASEINLSTFLDVECIHKPNKNIGVVSIQLLVDNVLREIYVDYIEINAYGINTKLLPMENQLLMDKNRDLLLTLINGELATANIDEKMIGELSKFKLSPNNNCYYGIYEINNKILGITTNNKIHELGWDASILNEYESNFLSLSKIDKNYCFGIRKNENSNFELIKIDLLNQKEIATGINAFAIFNLENTTTNIKTYAVCDENGVYKILKYDIINNKYSTFNINTENIIMQKPNGKEKEHTLEIYYFHKKKYYKLILEKTNQTYNKLSHSSVGFYDEYQQTNHNTYIYIKHNKVYQFKN